MPTFQGSVLGALLTLLGWDGADFRNVKVDSSGHLQVDVLANVLGGDQATETTLGTVKDRLGALTTPAAGSTNKLLTDSLTALQLVDDLRGALDSVDTDELVVNVDESALPSGAATEASVQGIEDAVPDQLLGYSNTYRETVSDLSADAGANTLQSSAVPSGKLHIITAITAFDVYNGVTSIDLSVRGIGSSVTVARDAPVAADQSVAYSGYLVMRYPEFIAATFAGVTAADRIYLQIAGHVVTA